MRNIRKGQEPQSLRQHRASQYASYENYGDKDVLRGALVTEQQWLCCYCMGRIKPDASKMKIEHWQCQANHRGRELDYRNLLGACLGGEGQPPSSQHCDTRKGNDDLLWNPAETIHAVEAKVDYLADGTISSSDNTFNDQLNEVLNLNLAILKESRKKAYDGFLEWWRKEKDRLHRPVPRSKLQRKKDKYVEGGGKLPPFCQVAVSLIDRKLEQAP